MNPDMKFKLVSDDEESAVLYVVECTEYEGLDGDTILIRWTPAPGLHTYEDEEIAEAVCESLYMRLPKPTRVGYRVRKYQRTGA